MFAVPENVVCGIRADHGVLDAFGTRVLLPQAAEAKPVELLGILVDGRIPVHKQARGSDPGAGWDNCVVGESELFLRVPVHSDYSHSASAWARGQEWPEELTESSIHEPTSLSQEAVHLGQFGQRLLGDLSFDAVLFDLCS